MYRCTLSRCHFGVLFKQCSSHSSGIYEEQRIFCLVMQRFSLAKKTNKKTEQNILVVLDLAKITVADLKLMLIKPESFQIFI